MLFKKILFATDFSEVSTQALDYVIRLKEAGCTDVVLVNVIDIREMSVVLSQPAGVGAPEGEFEFELIKRMHKRAEEQLAEVATRIEAAGLNVKPHLLDGIPATEITRIADAEKVSLIVVGSHGRSNIAQMLLGSVSENVIRHAKQPVFVVRRVEPPPE